jgi:hypothetical protein
MTTFLLCSNCGTPGGNLKQCSGTCGGIAYYCNQECQVTHYKKEHKKTCWKKASSPCFVAPSDTDPLPDVPLRAYRQLDGFGCSGVSLYYSNHMGEEFIKPHVIDIYGEYNLGDGKNLESVPWSMATSPVYDDRDRSSLKPGEAVFNIEKLVHQPIRQ